MDLVLTNLVGFLQFMGGTEWQDDLKMELKWDDHVFNSHKLLSNSKLVQRVFYFLFFLMIHKKQSCKNICWKM